MSFYDHFTEQEIAILRARAARLVSAQQADYDGAAIPVLLVKTGSETFALPMDALTAVYEGCTIVPVPSTPEFFAGVTGVRGQILPVLDLAVLLGVPAEGARQALVVVANHELTLGLCADAIGEATVIRAESLQAVPAARHGNGRDYVSGVTPEGVALLSVEAILNDPSLVVDESID